MEPENKQSNPGEPNTTKPQNAKANPRRRDDTVEFAKMCLSGPAIFLTELLRDPSQASDLRAYSDSNCRNFLLQNILIEVQKAGLALLRLSKSSTYERFLASEDSPDTITNEIESLTDELSLWQRKLSEGLVLLINFSSTNGLPHYYHFLLTCSREDVVRKLREQSDYFGKKNTADERLLQSIDAKIAFIRSQISDPVKECWYLNDPPKPKSGTSSFSRQLQFALNHCMDEERRALAFTYAKGFGDASSSIHFSNLRPLMERPQDKLKTAICFIGLLSCAIIRRVHAITGVEPDGINRSITAASGRVTGTDPIHQRAVVGDIVITDGPQVGVVEEIYTSTYGYESYRVRFLHLRNTANASITEDWFSAFEVFRYMSGDELKRDVERQLGILESQGMLPPNPPPTESELTEVTQLAIAEMLAHGLDILISRTLKPLIHDRIDPAIK